MYTTLLNCFTETKNATAIQIVLDRNYDTWLAEQPQQIQSWAKTNNLRQKKILLVPNAEGVLTQAICVIKDEQDWLSLGALPMQLPEGQYQFSGVESALLSYAYLAWGMGAYQFTRYKKAKRVAAQLAISDQVNFKEITHTLEAIYLVRDLINTPTDDMTPTLLAKQAATVAGKFQGKFTEIIGADLLKENYPCVYHVGRGSAEAPRLVELRWGKATDPKVTLVGKGVCFDTGGLDIKSAGGMLTMKKDMGGAATALGLAQLIMAQNLPIQLRVLLPMVENSVSGNAYHPGDVLTSRTGKTVEILNTDAEGRLILCDALAAACEEPSELLIDFATLTGAARIAVGTEIAAFFTPDNTLAQTIATTSETINDPCWRMPLYQRYRKMLDSSIADIANCSLGGYAGAITAALYLQEFVQEKQKWVHFDIMAANDKASAGKPEGGEAMALRTMYEILKGN